MKSGLATGIFALEALCQSGIVLDGDLMIQCGAGKETGGCGTLTADKMRTANVELYTYPGQEISIKGTGGPTCLTCPILR
jgi:acetylornithine deacetylase/succinyl-diaminopimelate desuccinylase-like protein